MSPLPKTRKGAQKFCKYRLYATTGAAVQFHKEAFRRRERSPQPLVYAQEDSLLNKSVNSGVRFTRLTYRIGCRPSGYEYIPLYSGRGAGMMRDAKNRSLLFNSHATAVTSQMTLLHAWPFAYFSAVATV